MTRTPLATAVAAALAAAGCGLVDPNITEFQLYVQDKVFAIDTEQWELAGVDVFTGTDCSTQPGVCAVAAEQACAEGQCFGVCGAAGTCELQVVVGLYQAVDVDAENQELRMIAEQPVVDVELDAIEFEVIENTLNVDTPELTIYAAPSTITAWGDPEARPVGTIPSIPPGMLLSPTQVALTDQGRAALEAFMGDYMTPFNIIVGAPVVIGAGDTVPQGRVQAVVQIRAHAGL